MCYYEQQKSHTGVLSIIVEFLWQFYILIAEDISAHFLQLYLPGTDEFPSW